MQELILYTNDAPILDPERFAGWQLVARGKQKCDALLQKQSLELQGILFGWEQADQKTLADKLAAYRKAWGELVDIRKNFTVILDNLKEATMKTEKEYDPKNLAQYKYAEQRELEFRKEAAQEAAKMQAKAQEIARFNAHVMNQYAAVAMDLKARFERIAQEVYEHCLHAKTPEAEIGGAKDIAIQTMAAEKPLQYSVFQRTLITNQEAAELGNKIQPPDFKAILEYGVNFLESRFSMYANDLANAEAAIINSRTELQASQVTAQAEADQAAAINQLAQTATAYVEPGPTVKKTTSIVVETDSEKFVMTIMAAFMGNFQQAFKKLRVKDYSKINVGQMAAALDAAGVTVEGVTYKTIEK